MARFCPNCGTRLEDGDRFCASCGQALEQTPVLQSAHPAHIDTLQHLQSEYQPQQQYPQQVTPPAQRLKQPPQQYPQQQPLPQRPTPPAPLQPPPAQPPQPQPQQYAPPQQPRPQPPQNYPPPQYYYPPPSSAAHKSKPPFLIWGIAGIAVVALVVVMILTNMFGLIKKGDGSGSAGNSGSAKDSGTEASAASDTESGSKSGGSGDADYVNTYEIFGDGALIKAPQRLTAKASPDDGLSAAALVGPWKGYRNSVTTEYGFADDGCYYKNVTITHAHLNSTYHPGYYSGDYYYYGTWTYNTTYTYTYLDTVVGEYRVKGGVLELYHIFTTERTIFDDDWFHEKTRSVDIGQLRSRANSARYNDEIAMEFEFINTARIRIRTESEDMDLFWDIEDDLHNMPIPKHEIPPVDWPAKALSPDMPVFSSKGRLREASLSYSGNDANISPEFKTVTVVIDKTSAVPEIDAYSRSLKSSGWWVEDYELDSDSSYLSYESRKGMFKLSVSNGRGSGTSDDTIVIESDKYQEGVWPKAWTDATLVMPDNAVVVGEFDIETGVDINVYETIIFDKVDDAGVNAYKNKLIAAGFKKPYYSYDDWDFMKYVRISGDLYLARIGVSKRMDSLTAFTYDLTYVEDGVWPASWTSAGLFPPDSYDAIAGAIDKDYWDERMADYDSDYIYVKYLNLNERGIADYMSKLKAAGFTAVKDWDGNDTDDLYIFLRIEGRLVRVEICLTDNEDITEIRYEFYCYEDGVWPSNWLSGGLPAPDSYNTIVGPIDLDRWNEDLSSDWGDSTYMYVKYLGMTAGDASQYASKLKNAGFRAVRDWDGNDTDELYCYLRIDGKLLRVTVEQRENYELKEFLYYFTYYEDGEWPAQWTAAGIPAPTFTAMAGKIDMTDFKYDLENWGSSYAYVKLLGANLSDYAAALRKSGFREPEYSWTDTWELEKRVQINGQWVNVTIEDRNNAEIPELYIYFQSE